MEQPYDYISNVNPGVLDRAYDLIDTEDNEEIVIIPHTFEGKRYKEWLYDYQFDDDGKLIHQSIKRYGCYEEEITVDGVDYTALVIGLD